MRPARVTLFDIGGEISAEGRVSMGVLALKNYLSRHGVRAEVIPAFEMGLAEAPRVGKVAQFFSYHERRLGDILGFSCTSDYLPQALLFADVAKRLSGRFILFGGVGPSLAAEEIVEKYPFVDAVCVGEGEDTLLELATRVSRPDTLSTIGGLVFLPPGGSVTRTRPRHRILSLDSLPVTYQEMPFEGDPLGYNRMVYLTTSRGCPGACSFCSQRALWEGFRSVLSMEALCRFLLKKKYGGDETLLAFQDDTFVVPEGRLRSLETALAKHRLQVRWASFGRVTDIGPDTAALLERTGCDEMVLGVDGHSNDIMRGMNKGYDIKRAKEAIRSLLARGIAVRINLIWDWPGESYGDFERMVGFAYESLCLGATVALSRLSIYPKTAVFSKVRSDLTLEGETQHALDLYLGDSAPLVRRDPLLFPNFLGHGYSREVGPKKDLLRRTAFLFVGDQMRESRRPIRWLDRQEYAS